MWSRGRFVGSNQDEKDERMGQDNLRIDRFANPQRGWNLCRTWLFRMVNPKRGWNIFQWIFLKIENSSFALLKMTKILKEIRNRFFVSLWIPLAHCDSERIVRKLYGSSPHDFVIFIRRLRTCTPMQTVIYKSIDKVSIIPRSFLRQDDSMGERRLRTCTAMLSFQKLGLQCSEMFRSSVSHKKTLTYWPCP